MLADHTISDEARNARRAAEALSHRSPVWAVRHASHYASQAWIMSVGSYYECFERRWQLQQILELS